jgi:Zinc finger, C2H2 type
LKFQVIDEEGFPISLICPRCEIDLTSAARFKKISLIGDSYFRKQCKQEPDIELMAVYEQDQEVFQEEFDMQEEEIFENEEVIAEEVEDNQFEIISDEQVEVLDEFAEDMIAYDEDPETEDLVEINVKRRRLPRKQSDSATYKHRCEFCGSVYPNRKRLQNHIQVNHVHLSEADLLECRMCGKKFKLQSYLETHIRNIHTDNPMNHRRHVSCSQCGKVLKSTIALKNHEALHTSTQLPDEIFKPYQCDKCGLRFRLKSYIFNHIHNVHLKNKYRCDICQLGFYKRYELEDHYRMHNNERPILCEFEGCGKTFARAKNYQIHQRVHTGERPYACEFCQRTFQHFIDRKRHIMTHVSAF